MLTNGQQVGHRKVFASKLAQTFFFNVDAVKVASEDSNNEL